MTYIKDSIATPCICQVELPEDFHPLIQTHQLSLQYGSKSAFGNVTLSIPAGEITAIVGPSGCGKSSFLCCLNRLTDLIPCCQVSGDIQIGTLNVLHPKTDAIALRRRVSLICQKPNPFPLSIWKNLVFPLQEHGIKDRDRLDQIVENSLRAVGLWDEVKDRLQSSALSLSGGQQQRLCIARALALNPQVILMDEPCSALDPISSGVVEDLILNLRNNYTVVIVTHNLPQARRIADYVACFWVNQDRGQLIEYGVTEQIFAAPQNPITAAYVNGSRG
ncbi:phosphate ABC transporter ATP-binding protein [Merismopedia glauca]|uniref:Phosphate ABC transporter ATP-binding protein n=1 Tax=Merismopedia glauca CCAP 1448/3 TaxID=1296344 RepID=A0A2T1C6G1_9CYAN|nr:phosphate ABC transporter ATP-binding protein [Merismopedia glauca]PSB03870.1 phosphate ABC transporter ATP-binding protein [Merismopedia glauca CCAP 1448/3]